MKTFPGDNSGTGDAHTPVAQEYCKEHIEENGPQDLLVNDTMMRLRDRNSSILLICITGRRSRGRTIIMALPSHDAYCT
jgi:hypothetical protein